MIDAAALRAWCLARPGVTEELPFGPVTTVFKVEGKVFALSALDRTPLRDLAQVRAGAGGGAAPRPPGDPARATTSTSATGTPSSATARCPDQMVIDMLEDSYDLVVEGLPRATRERLGWSSGGRLT